MTRKLDLNLGAETWTLLVVDQKYMESFEMLCWRRMEKISWMNFVRNGAVSHAVTEGRNILHTVKDGKLIGLVTCCVGTSFQNTLKKKR